MNADYVPLNTLKPDISQLSTPRNNNRITVAKDLPIAHKYIRISPLAIDIHLSLPVRQILISFISTKLKSTLNVRVDAALICAN